jgi:hypothetical protein
MLNLPHADGNFNTKENSESSRVMSRLKRTYYEGIPAEFEMETSATAQGSADLSAGVTSASLTAYDSAQLWCRC